MQNAPDAIQPTADQKMWAMFSHFGFLIGGFLTPLIIWQVKKDESAFIVANAKNALNWGLSLMLAVFAFALVVILFAIAGGPNVMTGAIILLYLLAFVLAICNIIISLMSGLKANKGEVGTYPFSIRFVK